jgi:DNA-binding XRE family transcriptional regulator
LTKTALAPRAGIDLRSVTNYETEVSSPKLSTAESLASALKFPLEFFYGDDLDEPLPDSASFRAMTKMTATQRDMALSQGAIALHLNNWLESKFELPKPDLPDLSRELSPEAAADSLRRYWALGVLPIKNMIHLLARRPSFFSIITNRPNTAGTTRPMNWGTSFCIGTVCLKVLMSNARPISLRRRF